jgi:putative ABC transport system permease protein
MEFRPIVSALLRNRTGAVLVALQVAITLAVLSNAFFIIEQRVAKMERPTGIDSANLVFVQSYGYAPGYDHAATVRADLALLRAVPGVIAASPINAVPMSGGGSAETYQPKSGPAERAVPGNYFEIDEQGLAALGVRLLAGRGFAPAELTIVPPNNDVPPVLIVTETMASKLFGTEPAVGRLVYDNTGKSAEVIGVVTDMLGSWVNNIAPGPTDLVFGPVVREGPGLRYVIRTRPGERDRLIPELERRLAATGHGRSITWARPHEYFIARAYRPDHRMVVFLTALVILMTSVTALGVVGLATYHVNARRKQIGTRRALGARRTDVMRYFLVENGILGGAGVVVGALLAYGFNHWLTRAFELPPLPVAYVAASAVGLLVLGQLAVLWPARRAAGIPPAVATRTV